MSGYLAVEWQAVVDATQNYLDALAALQAECEHKTVIKYTNSDYRTTRACEDCGYHERVQWDSPYKYQDQRLLGRAYVVTLPELVAALPKVSP